MALESSPAGPNEIPSLLERAQPPWHESTRTSSAGVRERILALTGIAASNDSTISIEELSLLLPTGSFPDSRALDEFLRTDRILSSLLVVVSGEVTLATTPGLVSRRQAQRDLTSTRLLVAERFVSRLERACPWIVLAGVSGSTAFGAAKPQDDIDFFLVTRRGRMWVTLLIAMTTAKLARMRWRDSPVFCFNRVTEEESCLQAFQASRDSLFAREALNLRVLRGHTFYHALLGESPWMSEYFPGLYQRRRTQKVASGPAAPARYAPGWSLPNELAFLLLAPYLQLAGLVRNARLMRQGRVGALFRTVVRKKFCAYESRKYEALGDAYRRAI